MFEALLGLAGPEAAQELLSRMIADLSRVERGLVAGLSAPTFAAVQTESHVLLSVAGAVGAGRLQELARELCAAARREDSVAMQLIGRSVLTQIDRLIAYAGRRQRQFERGGA